MYWTFDGNPEKLHPREAMPVKVCPICRITLSVAPPTCLQCGGPFYDGHIDVLGNVTFEIICNNPRYLGVITGDT